MEHRKHQLNSLIRDLAIRGQAEDAFLWQGEITINWQILGSFVAVYFESCYYTYRFRLFQCSGVPFYDRKMVVDPSYENEDYSCLYDYYIDFNGKGETKHFSDGSWYSEFIRESLDFLNGR